MEKIKNKIAITGASGFIGRHLLEDIDPSAFELYVITRNAGKKINNIPAGAVIREADLTDYDSLNKAFLGIDIIINMAAEVRNAEKLEETNITGTKNLIRAAVENKVSKIIHLSSVGVVGAQYSKDPLLVDEQSDCYPKNEYERTKLESERLLIEAQGLNGFSLVILRPTNVFGEYHPFNALLNFITHIDHGKIVLNSPSSVVNYVYVKDLTGLIIHLLNDNRPQGIYNAGNAFGLSDFMDLIAHELNKKPNKKAIPQFLINFIEALGIKKLRSVSNAVSYDDRKLKAFYNYPYGLEKGLKRTITYYKKQDLIK